MAVIPYAIMPLTSMSFGKNIQHMSCSSNLISMTVEHRVKDSGRLIHQSSVLVQPTHPTFS